MPKQHQFTTDANHSYINQDFTEKQYYGVGLLAAIDFIKNNYHIEGIAKESEGDNHDASWQKLITIFQEDGVWSEYFKAQKQNTGDLYHHPPKFQYVKHPGSFDWKKWVKKYDLSGNDESYEREIFATVDNKAYYILVHYDTIDPYKEKPFGTYKNVTVYNLFGYTTYDADGIPRTSANYLPKPIPDDWIKEEITDIFWKKIENKFRSRDNRPIQIAITIHDGFPSNDHVKE